MGSDLGHPPPPVEIDVYYEKLSVLDILKQTFECRAIANQNLSKRPQTIGKCHFHYPLPYFPQFCAFFRYFPDTCTLFAHPGPPPFAFWPRWGEGNPHPHYHASCPHST